MENAKLFSGSNDAEKIHFAVILNCAQTVTCAIFQALKKSLNFFHMSWAFYFKIILYHRQT
jgi:hypothetical protein